MEVGVRIESENTLTGEIKHTASAYLTFVSLDKQKNPAKVCSVEPQTSDEKRRFENAEIRNDLRKDQLSEMIK